MLQRNMQDGRRGSEIMTYKQMPARIGRFFTIFGSSIAVASATREGRQPNVRDLEVLGIDPAQFRKIRQS
ncbi:hypothetical protein PPNSA23_03970 [Phyllobacterium phragmitis]|uniref:DUF1127 domain-containing protein n=2 Tax=Hyphomicrobiales TaxID=356 RepID=A0ABQ0GUX0_9HYPH